MRRTVIQLALIALLSFTFTSAHAQANTYSAPAGKEIFIPKDLQSNDFTQKDSKWSFARCAYTDDVIIFWEKPFGDDLSHAPELEGHNMNVDLQNLLTRVQQFYDYFKNDLKFIKPGSNADKYRMMVMLNYSLEGTAYGGDYDNVIGALWITPNRVQDQKLNCIAHELGHSFQSMISCDGQGESWGGGGIFEMCSQWMLFNVNPEWPTDENYHWKAFIEKANLRFLALDNIYHSPYILEYWSQKHGLTVMGDLFREGKRGEDPASTYMRMFNLTPQDLASECVDCYSRLLTFDFDGKHEQNKQYTGEFINNKPLEQFGANVIPLEFNGKRFQKFLFNGEGDEATDGFAYRLVAVNDKAQATYGSIHTEQKSLLRMALPEDTKSLYLVVTAYPKDDYTPMSHKDKGTEEKIYKYSITQN